MPASKPRAAAPAVPSVPVHFDPGCIACPRLAGFLVEVSAAQPDYFCKPVPPFGDARAGLLIVGLAPGMHGANRTGRPFTGDHAGILLYATLHEFGFASHAGSGEADDGLELRNCRITNAVKCLPPQNKPETAEIRRCNAFLAAELAGRGGMARPRAVLALGSIAHQSVLMALGHKAKDWRFAHHAVHELPATEGYPTGLRLYDSYHCSRYNTQTRRLTTDMFRAVISDIRDFLRERP
jgi:uracil-DNA glycosylase family 4